MHGMYATRGRVRLKKDEIQCRHATEVQEIQPIINFLKDLENMARQCQVNGLILHKVLHGPSFHLDVASPNNNGVVGDVI